MKRLSLILFLLLTSLSNAQTKRALTIFIGDYGRNDGKGWTKISSVNDSSLILPALRKQGFSMGNIDVVVNEQATRLGIEQAFQLLISNTKLNDLVVVHISAHGEQIQDENGDELDGLDESIVLYGALAPIHFLNDTKVNYDLEVQNYLRDEELGAYIDEIRKKAGPKGEVLVIMDNCHSGSGTRDPKTIFRGGQPAIIRQIKANSTSNDKNVSVDAYSNDDKLAPFTVISASQAHELNQEIRIKDVGYGSLSYAVSKALNLLSTNSTYEGFYSEVRSELNLQVPKQHPVIEGNALNKKFWGGAFVAKPKYFNIKAMPYSNEFTLDAGSTSGLTIGTKVYLYPADTYDTTKAKLITTGTINSIGNFDANVLLDGELKNASAWVFVKTINYQTGKFKVEFDGISEDRIKLYKTIFPGITNIDESASTQLIVTKRNGKEVLINLKNNYAIDTLSSSIDTTKFKQLINRYIKSEYMRSNLINENLLFYKVELLKYDKTAQKVDTTISFAQNGVVRIKAGTDVVVKFTNHNTKRVYFNILDLQPDGVINAIAPRTKKNIMKEDLFVEPGETKIFTSFSVKINPPLGDEIFKIYVGKEAFDLQHLATEGARVGIGNKDEAVFNYNFIIER